MDIACDPESILFWRGVVLYANIRGVARNISMYRHHYSRGGSVNKPPREKLISYIVKQLK